jgi:AraC-like DNA-binding protein
MLHTADVDEATAALARIYIAAQIEPVGVDRLNVQLNAVELPSLTAGYCSFGSDVHAQATEIDDYYINIPLSGDAVNCWADGQQIRTDTRSAAIFTPGTPAAIAWSGTCGQLCIKIPRQRMREELEALLDRPAPNPVTFARHLDLTTGGARNWLQLVRILDREVGRSDGILSHRLAIDSLQQLLIHGVLQIQSHSYTEALTDGGPTPSSDEVTRGIELMRAHPEWPWSSAELARAVGVSARALQKAFQRSGEMTPMRYLRWLRLHRVRTELVHGSPDLVTVTTVASRWGFVHLGRFGVDYRQLFGETPSETLRGSVSRLRSTPR